MKAKLFLFSCFMACCGTFHSVRAQIIYPYFPSNQTANDLSAKGGTSVNPAAFLPPATGDYTLELIASGAITVSGNDIKYSYQPEANGAKVRFVKKDGVIHVYENTKYKGVIKEESQASFPDIFAVEDDVDAKTGIYDSRNLFQNPGFEEGGAQGSDFKDGIYWDALNASKESSWGAWPNSSIREGGRNLLDGDGRALYFHENGRYLTQNIGTGKLKSNTYYQLKFKHKVHANTGSITYSILLGTEKADLSIDSIPAFTTPSSAIISDIEFYFKTKDNVLSNVDIWFAFQRAVLPNTANCWFDRMTLVEANNIAASGISGVSSGIYLSGSAFAPEITLGTGDMIDCTQFVVNPNFDKNNQGWTSTTGAQNNKLSTGKAGVFTPPYWENWNGSDFSGKMYQTLQGLPVGKYKIQIAAFSTKIPEDEYVYVYAGKSEDPAEADTVRLFTTDPFVYTLEADVFDGTLEIGLCIEGGTNWVGIDNVRLYYVGVDKTLVLDALELQIAEAAELTGKKMHADIAAELAAAKQDAETKKENAGSTSLEVLEAASARLLAALTVAKEAVKAVANLEELLDKATEFVSKKMQASVLADLTAAKATAEALTGTTVGTTEALKASIETLTAELEKAESSINAYDAFKNLLDEAERITNLGLQNGDKSALDAAITIAKAVYEPAASNEEEIKTAQTALDEVLFAYSLPNASPNFVVDVTRWIKNSNFEDSDISMWIINSTPAAKKGLASKGTGNVVKDGHLQFYGESGNTVSGNVTYRIDDITMPEGYYNLSMGIYTNNMAEVNLAEVSISAQNYRHETIIEFEEAVAGEDWAEKFYSLNSLTVTEDDYSMMSFSIEFLSPLTLTRSFTLGIDNITLLYSGNAPATSISSVITDGRELMSTEYYNIQGIKVGEPIESGIYIVKKIYKSGLSQSEKVFYKKQ